MTLLAPTHLVDDDEAVLVSLRTLTLFSDLPSREQMALAEVLVRSSAPPGLILQVEGGPVSDWRIIVSGHAVVERSATPIALLGRGDAWMEHGLVDDGTRSPVGVVALSPSVLLTATRARFLALLETHPMLSDHLLTRSAGSTQHLASPVLTALLDPYRGQD